ncbi:MAG TPA: hypothetical protein VL172_00765 [Kofleriaceae bacterium]|nr:hypothetical protein [Kofleriaceae bacterium]
MSAPDTKLPSLIGVGLLAGALVIAILGGFTHGSIGGAVLAALAVIPALWGSVNGLQHETQKAVAAPVLILFGSIGIAGLLLVLRIVDWVR